MVLLRSERSTAEAKCRSQQIVHQTLSWAAREQCIHCLKEDFDEDFGPRTLVMCDCCGDLGTHIGCLAKEDHLLNLSQAAVESPSFQWFCSESCSNISKALTDATGVKQTVSSGYTFEIIRYSETFNLSQRDIGAAIKVLHAAFSPVRCENGQELIEMICRAYESPESASDEAELYDFTGFRVAVIRKHASIVSVAPIRVVGALFAEVPFIATMDGYRREGNCRRLLAAIDRFLKKLDVEWLLLPAVQDAHSMWTKTFGFEEFIGDDAELAKSRVYMPEDSILLRKKVGTINTQSSQKRVRFEPGAYTESMLDDEPSSATAAARGAEPNSSEMSIEEEEEEEEKESLDEMDLVQEDACIHCWTKSSKKWHEVENLGTLCSRCNSHLKTKGDLPQEMPMDTTVDRQCLNCSCIDSRRWFKIGEGWECGSCGRYRQRYRESRPARLFKKPLPSSSKKTIPTPRTPHIIEPGIATRPRYLPGMTPLSARVTSEPSLASHIHWPSSSTPQDYADLKCQRNMRKEACCSLIVSQAYLKSYSEFETFTAASARAAAQENALEERAALVLRAYAAEARQKALQDKIHQLEAHFAERIICESDSPSFEDPFGALNQILG